MTKKADSLVVNINRQQDLLEREQEKLFDMVADLNEERLTTITKVLRSLSKESVIGILDYFIGDHLFDCTDNNITYHSGTNGDICPRCAFLFLYKNKSEAAPYMLKNYLFGMHVDVIGKEEDDGDEE